jgi:hypothetical protein
MQDAGLWNPSVQQWGKSLPPHLCSLTAPDENTPPQPVDTSLKDTQLSLLLIWICLFVVPRWLALTLLLLFDEDERNLPES